MGVTVRLRSLEREIRQGRQGASPGPAEVANKWEVTLAERPQVPWMLPGGLSIGSPRHHLGKGMTGGP